MRQLPRRLHRGNPFPENLTLTPIVSFNGDANDLILGWEVVKLGPKLVGPSMCRAGPQRPVTHHPISKGSPGADGLPRRSSGSPLGCAGSPSPSGSPPPGQEIRTALVPSLLTSTLGAPASALVLLEGVSDGLTGASRPGRGELAGVVPRRTSLGLT